MAVPSCKDAKKSWPAFSLPTYAGGAQNLMLDINIRERSVMEKDTDTHKPIIEALQRKHMDQVILLLQDISPFLLPKDSYDDIWETFINQPNLHTVVVTDNGKVVGYGAVIIETKIRGGKMGHIEDIVSHPNKRNKGVGKIVVNALYEIAKKNNCYKVALQCQKANIPFYEKCEYRLSGTAMQRFIK